MFLKQLKFDQDSNHYMINISCEVSSLPSHQYYHRDKNEIESWIKLLQVEACNQSFDDVYIKGKQLGKGKFSTVYQCQHKETLEIFACKQINLL